MRQVRGYFSGKKCDAESFLCMASDFCGVQGAVQ